MELKDIIKPENLVYAKSDLIKDVVFNYCPGCSHGTATRLVAEVIQEMGLADKTIGVAPVGCSVLIYEFYDFDMVQAAHGRATAVATGLKRVMPDKVVFTYQGDGDLAAIGTGETIHACNRGENIVIIFINNGIYGMTGGQMAPTTLPGMVSSTSPFGRDTKKYGKPINMSQLVANFEGTYYVTRQAVHTPAGVRKTKRAMRKAFENQLAEKGTSFIEIIASCNSGWKMDPVPANKWMEDNMISYYPLGDIKVDGVLV